MLDVPKAKHGKKYQVEQNLLNFFPSNAEDFWDQFHQVTGENAPGAY